MINICFVMYDISVLGGAEKASINLINKLAEKFKIMVLSIKGNSMYKGYKLNPSIQIKYAGLTSKSLRQLKKEFDRYILKEKKKYDLYVGEGYYASYIISNINSLLKTKSIFVDHGSVQSQIKDKKATIMRFLTAHRMDKIILLTNESMKYYNKKFLVRREKTQVIYNYIENDLLRIAQNTKYKGNSKIIISVGRFGVEKGYDMAVEVARKVFEQRKDLIWKLYGDGETFNEIRKKIEEYHIEENMILMGETIDIRKAYSEAEIFVLPSYREGLPLVLLEAMAYHIPMISFDIITGPREIIEDEKNGYLIEPYDIDKMADRIIEIMNDENKRKEMSKNNQYYIAKFSEKKIVTEWINLFVEIVK